MLLDRIYSAADIKEYEKMKNHLGNQAKRTITDLGLEKYRTFCFRNVYSFDKEEFNEFLERNYQN